MCSGRSATSSRNSVPPSALCTSPFLSATAPVKLPRLWPKSSLSMSSVGMAPQLTATNGPSRRAPLSWIMRATSSLPVPDSPQMCTGAWLRATRPIISRSCSMTARAAEQARPAQGGGGLARRCAGPSLMALPTSLRSTPRSSGFETKSKAPSFSARTADSTLPCAVITATGTAGAVLLDPGDQIESVAVRQAHVRQAQVEALALEQPARACRDRPPCGSAGSCGSG